MHRILSVSIIIVLSLLPAVTSGAPAQKRHIYRWHGYGFLPGYHQPPNNAVPIYGRKGTVTGEPDYSPRYFGYDGELHYFGRPGFVRGRYNGGSFGPCWSLDADRAVVAVRAEVSSVVVPGRCDLFAEANPHPEEPRKRRLEG